MADVKLCSYCNTPPIIYKSSFKGLVCIDCPQLQNREFGFYENFKKKSDAVTAWNSHRYDLHRKMDDTFYNRLRTKFKNLFKGKR